MLTAIDFKHLFTQRFFHNFFPIPATNLLTLGAVPPDFELSDITHGRSVKLSDYWGKQSVIVAFTRIFSAKVYCPLCFPHIQALNGRYEEFTRQGAEVLMITSTDREQSLTVVQDLGLKFPLLSDSDCLSFRAYGVGQALGAPLPAQFVLDQEGHLRYKHLFSFLEANAGVDTLLSSLATQ
ncbi:alkyl hydroperoxide reductase [Neosynechococcus sphagnicola sy1]|uniref:Alkyl hydroperoxide reductase n=1 Tax=Neosynechococcus sphagnicola sy1 TaxID=1497020 RepID=A0A098THC9_9CYAN|nr:redoxin domain-containing protein [Neosynechococcus sphagnicola]KGF71990.1 alkyl hydroperoxide reductase [Neosynechococcus sphagnicola sy1]